MLYEVITLLEKLALTRKGKGCAADKNILVALLLEEIPQAFRTGHEALPRLATEGFAAFAPDLREGHLATTSYNFV